MKLIPFLICAAMMIWAAWLREWHSTALVAVLVLLCGLDAIAIAIKERK